MPTTENLRCFLEASRLLSFRAAARAVALSPAAFGQRIRQLEEELDTSLFRRTTRSVLLTEAGLALMPLAQRAVEAVDEVLRVAHGGAHAVPMELTLGTRHELGLSWLVPMLPVLRRQHPGLTVHLYFGSGPDLASRVRSVAIDCAVTSTRLTDPKVDSVGLHEEPYVFVGARKLLRRTPLDRAQDAAAHTLVDAGENLPLFHYWRDAPGGIDSIRFGAVLRMGTIAAIRQVVLRGDGVGVLPEYFVERDLKSGRLQRILPKVRPLSDRFRLVFRRDDPRRAFFVALARTMCTVPLR